MLDWVALLLQRQVRAVVECVIISAVYRACLYLMFQPLISEGLMTYSKNASESAFPTNLFCKDPRARWSSSNQFSMCACGDDASCAVWGGSIPAALSATAQVSFSVARSCAHKALGSCGALVP